MDLFWTCLGTCLEQRKSRFLISYIAIWWINSKVPEGSMITSENNSSRVIILKSRLNSTGHSSCTSEVRDIFDRQTHVPNHWWQLMYSRVLQPWGHRNSTTVPVRNIKNDMKKKEELIKQTTNKQPIKYENKMKYSAIAPSVNFLHQMAEIGPFRCLVNPLDICAFADLSKQSVQYNLIIWFHGLKIPKKYFRKQVFDHMEIWSLW